MRAAWLLGLVIVSGCTGNQIKGESGAPDMQPLGPARNVTVEETGDLICVTENGDPGSRSCVPRVHETDEEQGGRNT